MEDRSSRRVRTLVTPTARRGLSANKIACALISMMARSTTRSNQRPDTLMQDRSLPDRRNSLATHGRTIHLGHQCSHAPGRPVLHRRLILSQTSAGRRTTSSIAPHLACTVPLFVPGGCSFVPACACRRAARKGAVKAGRRARLACRVHAARPRLGGPEHGARITLDGTPSHRS